MNKEYKVGKKLLKRVMNCRAKKLDKKIKVMREMMLSRRFQLKKLRT